MVRDNELVNGIVGTLRNYAKAPEKDWQGYQKYCRVFPKTWMKIKKECQDAECKRIKEETNVG